MDLIRQSGRSAWRTTRRSLAVAVALAATCASLQLAGVQRSRDSRTAASAASVPEGMIRLSAAAPPPAPPDDGAAPARPPVPAGPHLATPAFLTSGHSDVSAPSAPLGPNAAAAPQAAPHGPPPSAASRERTLTLSAYARRLTAFRHWGLDRPVRLAPFPPAVKPAVENIAGKAGGPGLPPVVGRVGTKDRVVFLTIDDGTEKDRKFLSLLRDLQVPVSAFLTHDEAKNDYGYFRRLQRLGDGVHNHTITHPDLEELSYRRQRQEICRQQENLRRELGVTPRLFRPPYGNFDRKTLRAAKACGIEVVVMWGLEAWADRIDWQEENRRLRPGDIILTHFRGPAEWDGTMNDMARVVLGAIAEQGFAVGRLEDYL
ncbi:polysaccharide deacetylase family protein [Wenjunlia tyrosinilytica]|uniref:NodB homology domain-containing protein n=1 Tax=Wenjunlia tyrosinilytica TaxID=1544741 RepID=A0A917ZI54_9ACTN|nr:polysaccharide deacetylase family protein [Wenjunlia tyrosinilytica]GGO83545.1 hypothetical protein GCM10012280_12800 [Wenjunlia tyrosinilytica]